METMASIVREILSAALKAANPADAVERECGRIRSLYGSGDYSRLLVVGFGKAAIPMARAMEKSLGELITIGAVITKYGHGATQALKRVRVQEAGHPLPDQNGVNGTEEIAALAGSADERTLAAVLISGGGSALFVSPAEGISLVEKQETTSLLLRAGAEIQELNAVRKHLSRVKGGRLAGLLYPAAIVSLILSDVIGDPLEVIASGPTSPDCTTFADALDVLGRYDLLGRAPQAVVRRLENGRKGVIPETPKQGDPVFGNVENVIIGSNRLALNAAKSAAETLGMRADILSAEIAGEAEAAGRSLAFKALTAKLRKDGGAPACLISGGETTVSVTGSGIGGRNMELALAFAIEIEGVPGITLLSAGTDGTDGPTDAAGAVVDGMTIVRARARGLDPDEYLRNNDSYTFFRDAGGLLITGPTGTNVMDMQIVVIE
ncbi:glycerate kinase [bacterium]|nr:glycerate kinase [bacterium]